MVNSNFRKTNVKSEAKFIRFHLRKLHLKMSSVEWRKFCLGLNVLTVQLWDWCKYYHKILRSPQTRIFCHDDVIKWKSFPSQRPVTHGFDVFFDLCLNKRLSKHSWGWWFETPSRSLWRHCNVLKASHHCEICQSSRQQCYRDTLLISKLSMEYQCYKASRGLVTIYIHLLNHGEPGTDLSSFIFPGSY